MAAEFAASRRTGVMYALMSRGIATLFEVHTTGKQVTG